MVQSALATLGGKFDSPPPISSHGAVVSLPCTNDGLHRCHVELDYRFGFVRRQMLVVSAGREGRGLACDASLQEHR